jgi:hypothetical protein
LQAAGPHQVSWQLMREPDEDDDLSEAKRIASRETARLAG